MTTLWYRDGTVAVTAGSKVVTGTDTLWKYAEILDEGDIFTLDGTRLFEVASIDSDTQLTLTEDFVGTTGAGRTYSIIPNYAVRPYAPIIGRQMLLINKWLTREQELTDWQSAPPSGDPANPTRVTITAWNGLKSTYISLPQILSMIGTAMDWSLLANVPANITAWQNINPSTKQDFAPNLVDWSATTLASMASKDWTTDNFVDINGDVMTGDLDVQDASVSVAGGYLRASNWNGMSNNGVLVLGDTDSYVFKNGNQFDFSKSAANGQAAWTASLVQGGTILTTLGNHTITGAMNLSSTLNVAGRFFAGGAVDVDAGYQIVSESGVAYLDAKSRDNSLLKPFNLRGTTLKFNGNDVYTTANFNPGNYLPLAGGSLTGNVSSTGTLVIKNSIRVQDWGTPNDAVIFFGTNQSYIYKPGDQFQFTNVDGATPWTAYLKRAGDIMTSQGDFTLTGIFQATWVRALGAAGDTVRAEIRPGNAGEAWFQAVNKSTGAPSGKMFYRGDSHTWTEGNGNIVASLNNAGLLTANSFTTNGTSTASRFIANGPSSAVSTFSGSIDIAANLNVQVVTYFGGKPANNSDKIRIYNHDANGTGITIDSVNYAASAFSTFLMRGSQFILSGGRTYVDSYLSSNGSNLILSASAGAVYFRPNGADNATGEVTIGSNGVLTLNGSAMLRGNGKNIQVYDNNLDTPVVDIGSGIGTPTDRGGYVVNRNANGNLLLWGRNGGIKLQLGPDGNYAHFNNTVVSQPDVAPSPSNFATLAFQARNSYGGGYAMRDNAGSGNYWGGMYLGSGNMYLGVGAANTTGAAANIILKSNGQMYLTGNQLNIEGSSPMIQFYDTDGGYTNWLHSNDGNIGFLKFNEYAWCVYRDSANNFNCTGNIAAYASDARLKTNYRKLADPLGKLALLDAVQFDWDRAACATAGHTPQNWTEHGVIAQQVQKVFPEWVVPAPFNRDYLTVLYDRLSVFNLAVNKAQQAIIDDQAEKLRSQDDRIKDLEVRMAKMMARFNKWEAANG